MTTPITVLHAHAGNLYGGVETAITTLARHPHHVHHRFALCYHGRLATELRRDGADVTLLGAARWSRPWSVWGARGRFARLLDAQRPTAVLCHSPWSLAVFGPAVRARRIPLVLWAHGAYSGSHWLERLARLTAPPALALCNSAYTMAALPNAFPAIPAHVLRPPVEPPPTFGPARRPAKRGGHGATPDSVVITLVGRLERWKGHQMLIDALAALAGNPAWTAWIVGGAQLRGEEAYRVELERRANEARIASRVHFLGQRDDVASLLWASDIYCQPNTGAEPFGIALVEALYAGLPIVTTDLGGAREIVTPECGVLVPPADLAALRAALEQLLGDAALRRRLGAAGPARATELSAPAYFAERLATLLERVASRGTPAAEPGVASGFEQQGP
jgi:glycosyltransferase involved in cell wall biosynthesis